MSKTLHRITRPALALAALVSAGSALAVPLAETSPPPLAAGFQVDWVRVGTSLQNIAGALDALAGNGAIGSATEYRSTINLTDDDVPFLTPAEDPLVAIRVTGYITLAAGTYTFSSSHDDGVRLTVGGETVVIFDSNTSTTTTTSPSYTLPAGVYAVEAISWEQGGVFAFTLNQNDGSGDVLLAGAHAVPEPASIGLALAGLALVGAAVRRRQVG